MTFSSETAAKDVRLALDAGADFGKMAKAKSENVASRMQGGDVGYVAEREMSPLLLTYVSAMKEGEVSPVIQSSSTYCIVKVTGVQEPQAQVLGGALKKRITEVIIGEKVAKEYQGWIATLRSKAEITK
jgi:parvulin-like peptidyl-prolyl isomerase